MSQNWNDDDALDAALGALGTPSGATPRTTAPELLARASGGAPTPSATPTPSLRGMRQGLRGARLAAALTVAVGAGFLGGLRMRATQDTSVAASPDMTMGAPQPAVPADPPAAPLAATPTHTQDTVAARVVPDTRVEAPRRRHGGRPRVAHRRSARGSTAPTDAPTPERATTVHEHADARLAAADPHDTPFGETPDAPAPETPASPSAEPAPRPRTGDADARAESRGRFVLALGGARSTVSPDVPRDPPGTGDPVDHDGAGRNDAPRPATSAMVSASYSRVAAASPRAPWLKLGGSLGRTHVKVDEDEADHAHVSWTADLGAGVSWTRGRARLDTGVTVGTLGFLDSTRERHATDAPHAEAPHAPGPDEARAPLLTVGPQATLAIGDDHRPRLHLDVSPRLILARGHAPVPSLGVSLGGEFGLGRR